MNVKICLMLLVAVGMVFAENSKTTILGMDSLEVHELLKQRPTGPCHGPVDEDECIRWVNDSATVKKEDHPDYKWTKWRVCCNTIRDSIDASKKKRRKK